MKKTINQLILGTLCLFMPCALLAQAGTLDASFGTGGVATSLSPASSSNESNVNLLLQPDGKILIGVDEEDANNRFAPTIRRFNSNGTLDQTFGTGGKVSHHVYAGQYCRSLALTLQTDGKILMGGGSDTAVIIRYLPNGQRDATFGNNGILRYIVGTGTNNLPTAVALKVLPTGKIIAVTHRIYVLGGSKPEFFISRFNANGTLDTSFGTQGWTSLPLGTHIDIAGLEVQSSGKIVVGGSVSPIPSPTAHYPRFFLVRFTTNGIIDTSFGVNGIDSLHRSGGCTGMAMSSDDKILLCGTSTVGTVTRSLVIRYNVNGGIDNTFGNNGKQYLYLGNAGYELLGKMLVQPDGKILIKGWIYDSILSSGIQFFYRLNVAGDMDNTFGNAGVVTCTTYDRQFLELALQPDGKMISAGLISALPQDQTVGVARFLGNPSVGTLDATEMPRQLTAFPNPIGEVTALDYEVLKPAKITITMHDALGRTVAEFVTAAPREAGQQHETLTMPSNLSSGVYIITIHTDDIYKSVKIIKN